MAPFQVDHQPTNVNIGQQPEIVWSLPLPPPLPTYQPQNGGVRAGGQGPNAAQGFNPAVQNYVPPLEMNEILAPAPALEQGTNA